MLDLERTMIKILYQREKAFIEKKGEGIHHLAFHVNDLTGALSEAKENDIKLIDSEPRKGAEGLDIAFLHPKSTNGVLTELCEEK